MTFSLADYNNGNGLCADIEDSLPFSERHLSYLLDLINSNTFDPLELSSLVGSNALGMNIFDFFCLKCELSKHNPKSVVEFGCGSTTAFIKNLGYEVESFSLDDRSASSNSFNYIDTATKNGIDSVLSKCGNPDFVFMDGCHSFNGAKNIIENYILKLEKRIPILMHDFRGNDHPRIYGEQYYILNNFLSNVDNGYELKSYTGLLDNRFDEISSLHNSMIRCLGIIYPIGMQ